MAFRNNDRGGFNRRGSGRFQRNNFGRDRDSGRDRGFDRRPVEMHDATCDKCGKRCQVPFRPSGDKPVLCSDCFRQKDSGRSFSRDSDKSSSKEMVQINAKLDKIIAILEDLEIIQDDEVELADDDSDEGPKHNKVIVDDELDEDDVSDDDEMFTK